MLAMTQIPTHPAAALRIAVIEDDAPTSDQIKTWILAARPSLLVDQLTSRDAAEAALAKQRYAVIVLDIELGHERHAGVALINLINKTSRSPVLVVSAMPAAIYRSIMKALDAWDYLQKTTFAEHEFIETFLEVLRASELQTKQNVKLEPSPVQSSELSIDPLRQASVLFKGQRVNIPLTAQRILAVLTERKGDVVSYDELFAVVKSGRNRDNVRKHIGTIREALREIEPDFDGIDSVPMRGFRWR
jgi:DNA-binding response OmpR family regulator